MDGFESIADGIWYAPSFAAHVLGADASSLQASLEARYPTRGRGESIVPGVIQWIGGDNEALGYRGRAIKRHKIWLQRGDPLHEGYLRYLYTGWQWRILPATTAVEHCEELLPVADAYDRWAESVGYPAANHYIVTKYLDGSDNIGWHFDKPKDIANGSIITIVKTGLNARPFQVRSVSDSAMLFDRVLQPGDAIIMTLEANLATQHCVPPVDDVGPSGSVVFRTITTRVSYKDAMEKINKAAYKR